MEIVMQRMDAAQTEIESGDWVVKFEEQYQMILDLIHNAIRTGNHDRRVFITNPGMWRWFDSLPRRYGSDIAITRR